MESGTFCDMHVVLGMLGQGQKRGQPSLGRQMVAASSCSCMLDLSSWASCSASLRPSFLLRKNWRWEASLFNVVIHLTGPDTLQTMSGELRMMIASSGLGSHRITCFLGSHRWELSSQVSHWLPPVQIAYAGGRPRFKCKVCQIR